MIPLQPPGASHFHGEGGVDHPGGERWVAVERDGHLLGGLRHVVRHTPTGVSQGCAGPDPTGLALAPLADDLGRARCAAGDAPDHLGPCDPRRRQEPPPGGDAQWEASGRWDGDGGLRRPAYQALKVAVVAGLSAPRWVLPRGRHLDGAAHRRAGRG